MHTESLCLFSIVQRYWLQPVKQTLLERDHTAHSTVRDSVNSKNGAIYRVSDRGQLRVVTRWAHSKIDLTPKACSPEAENEKDWRWETAPTVGGGKSSLTRLRRCASSPRHLARAAGRTTRMCCEAWYAGAEGVPTTRADPRTVKRAHHPLVIRSPHADHPPRVILLMKSSFSTRVSISDYVKVCRPITLWDTTSLTTNFTHQCIIHHFTHGQSSNVK